MKTPLQEGFTFEERRRLARLIRQGDSDFVVLIGSWARGTQVPGVSDVDVLVGARRGKRCRDQESMHVICITSDELAHRSIEGDDVALWSLRYGIPLSGRGKWTRLREELLESAPWPNPQRKLEFAQRELTYARELFAMGDLEAAQEELRISIGHLARALLIKAEEFPLSRPELPEQLHNAGESDFVRTLNLASAGTLTRATLEDAIRQTSERLSAELALA